MKRFVHDRPTKMRRECGGFGTYYLYLHSATGSENVYVRLRDESGQKWDYNLDPAVGLSITHRIMLGFDIVEFAK